MGGRGNIQTLIYSVGEFRQLVQGRFSKYITEPNVTVALMGVAPPVPQR